MVTRMNSSHKLMVRFHAPHPSKRGFDRWLKGIFAMASALLVGFSCSFPPFVTDVYADNQTGIALYMDTFLGKVSATSSKGTVTGNARRYTSVTVPSQDRQSGLISTYNTGTQSDVNHKITKCYVTVTSGQFEPSEHDRWMIIALGWEYFPTYSYPSSGYSFNVLYKGYNDKNYKTSASGGKHLNDINFYQQGTTSKSNCYVDVVEVKVPANACTIWFELPANYYMLDEGYASSHNYFGAYSSWLWDDYSQVEVFNQMLQQLKDINAELDTQTKILNSIDGTTKSIYDILYNALHDESANFDKETQQVAEKVMQQENGERYWNDKNTENFNAIGLESFSFSHGVVSALGVVGGLFEGLWDSLGDASIIFLFPLIFGVALVVIGRVSRSSGKGKSKGGDKE